MALHVVVTDASNLPNVETLGQSDPYTIVEYQGIRKKTEVIKSDLNPTWDQKFEFDLKGQPLSTSDEITFFVKDWERVGRNRLLGQAKVPLRELVNSKQLQLSVNLLDGNARPTTAKLNVKMHYKAPSTNQNRADSSSTQMDSNQGLEDDDEEEEDEDYDENNALLDDVDGAPSEKKKKRKHKKRKLGTRKIRKNLSSKPQDFQIRVKIVEARQLPGSNISPIVRVSCYKQAKQSRVQKSTNSPFWSELFFFNFFCSPSELFDELITFGVYNSRQLRSDSFIGSFKCDIGMIHEEAGHSLINKWLLLSDPDDTQSGAKGYLKICVTILGPGDEAPSFKSTIQDDEEDIESNLLKPAGIQLRPATFKLKIYRAEDIPRMDSDFMQGVKKVFGSDDKKELVDPYFVFSFTGKEVRSKIMYNNDHPEWNQALSLGLQFPSMCERIKLQIFDWDRMSSDDAVGTIYLCVSKISLQGDHGMPVYGCLGSLVHR